MRNYKQKLGAAHFCPLTYNASRMSYREEQNQGMVTLMVSCNMLKVLQAYNEQNIS